MIDPGQLYGGAIFYLFLIIVWSIFYWIINSALKIKAALYILLLVLGVITVANILSASDRNQFGDRSGTYPIASALAHFTMIAIIGYNLYSGNTAANRRNNRYNNGA